MTGPIRLDATTKGGIFGMESGGTETDKGNG